MPKKRTSAQLEREIQEAVSWRSQVLHQIKEWLVVADPKSAFPSRTIMSRLDRLESFLRAFFKHSWDSPVISTEDAAGLIVMPKHAALKLARRLFRGGDGIAADLHAEDLTWNMDWFQPPGFR